MYRLDREVELVPVAEDNQAGRFQRQRGGEPDHVMSEPRKIGPFDVGKQLGVGGMGIVYLATYRETGQKVALKILSPALCADPKLITRFEREIEILKRLDHPNIVRYFGGGRTGSQRYYAMEYMDAGSLDSVLERKGSLSWEQTIKIGLQLSAALEHAHNHAIVHRDLKPANLFISKKGRLRLGDFGIAKDNDATQLTAAGKTVGTYAYMAPEQIHGKHPIGPRTDLYAMGCLLFQFLTGNVPFRGQHAAEIFQKHLKEEPESVCEHNLDCPIWLDRVIQRLMAKEPEDRPYDALAVQQLLEDVRTRVADQASMAQTAMTSGPVDTVVTAKDRTELKEVIKKKKKKRKKKRPFYESAWLPFLGLVLLVAGIAWSMQPESESVLFDRIAEGMQEKDNWSSLRKTEIEDYLARFPSGPHSTEVTEFRDEIEMDLAERRAINRERRNAEPKSEAEARYMQARQYEEFGDRLTAVEQYEALIKVFEEREEDRAFVNLAAKRIHEINAMDPPDRQKVVNDALIKANDFVKDAKLLKARSIWQSLVRLYGENRELSPQTEYCRACLQALSDKKEIPPLAGIPAAGNLPPANNP
ncbi:MAG: serine/threonine protein kinase [Planctomycetaceae bacterium]